MFPLPEAILCVWSFDHVCMCLIMLFGDFQHMVGVNVHVRKDLASLEICMLPLYFVWIYFRTRPEVFIPLPGLD